MDGIFAFAALEGGDVDNRDCVDRPHCWLLNGANGDNNIYVIDHEECPYILQAQPDGDIGKQMEQIFADIFREEFSVQSEGSWNGKGTEGYKTLRFRLHDKNRIIEYNL